MEWKCFRPNPTKQCGIVKHLPGPLCALSVSFYTAWKQYLGGWGWWERGGWEGEGLPPQLFTICLGAACGHPLNITQLRGATQLVRDSSAAASCGQLCSIVSALNWLFHEIFCPRLSNETLHIGVSYIDKRETDEHNLALNSSNVSFQIVSAPPKMICSRHL